MQRFVVFALVLFGEWWGREGRSCIDWPATVAVSPTLRRRPRDLEAGSDLADRPALVHDETTNDQAVAWGECCVGVRHGIFFGCATSPKSADQRCWA